MTPKYFFAKIKLNSNYGISLWKRRKQFDILLILLSIDFTKMCVEACCIEYCQDFVQSCLLVFSIQSR